MFHRMRAFLARLTDRSGPVSDERAVVPAPPGDLLPEQPDTSQPTAVTDDQVVTPTKHGSQAELAEAQALLAAGKLERAIAVLEAGLRRWPSEEVAATLEELRVIRRARKRLQRRPHDAQAHFELGRALFAQDCGAEALVHLEAACRLRPGWLDAQLLRAYELHWQGRWREAASAYQAVLALDPTHPIARRGFNAVQACLPPSALIVPTDLSGASWSELSA